MLCLFAVGPAAENPVVKLSFTARGLNAENSSVLAFIDCVLRGIGQVMFQDNTYAGVIFLSAVSLGSFKSGLSLFAGAVFATGTAVVLGVDRGALRAGLYGFNGALVGVAMAVFFHANPVYWVLLALGSVVATVLTEALGAVTKRFELVGLTAPFVLMTWVLTLSRWELVAIVATDAMPTARGAMQRGALAAAATVDAGTLLEGALRGIGQVFLQDNVTAGGLCLVALAVSSRTAAFAAFGGSLAGLLTAWVLGASETGMRAGLNGYNPALTAVALTVFLSPGLRTVLYTTVGVVLTVMVTSAMTAALAPLGAPVLTAPFVLVVWAFLAAAKGFSALCREGAEARGESAK